MFPYKTIDAAFKSQFLQAGDTVQIAGGSLNVHTAPEEEFPLEIPYHDITVVGTRATPPTLKLDQAAETLLDPLADKFALGIVGKSGCTIRNIKIEAIDYDKAVQNTADVHKGLHGIFLDDLPAGSLTVLEDLIIDDTFNGVFVDDSATPASKRTLLIRDCVIQECGPVPAAFNQGHAAIRLLEAKSDWFDLYVLGGVFEQNHDALEPGLATLFLKDAEFIQNENGLEYANTIGGSVMVEGCTFQLQERFDYPVNDPFTPTGAIVARYDGPGFDLMVRDCDFDHNQIGVSLRGPAGANGNVDFGTSVDPPMFVAALETPYATFSLDPRGGNTFTTDIDSPWKQGQGMDYSVSYCGLFNFLDDEVHAAGNFWTYHTTGDPSITGGADHNQGVGANGEVPSTSPLSIAPLENFDENPPLAPNGQEQIEAPFHRAWDGYGNQAQQDWNFSTGTEFGSSGLPRIILVP